MAIVKGWGGLETKKSGGGKSSSKSTSRKVSQSAIAVPASPSGGKVTESINIRPIENGYIIRKSVSGPKSYEEREYYSAKKPDIEV